MWIDDVPRAYWRNEEYTLANETGCRAEIIFYPIMHTRLHHQTTRDIRISRPIVTIRMCTMSCIRLILPFLRVFFIATEFFGPGSKRTINKFRLNLFSKWNSLQQHYCVCWQMYQRKRIGHFDFGTIFRR